MAERASLGMPGERNTGLGIFDALVFAFNWKRIAHGFFIQLAFARRLIQVINHLPFSNSTALMRVLSLSKPIAALLIVALPLQTNHHLQQRFGLWWIKVIAQKITGQSVQVIRCSYPTAIQGLFCFNVRFFIIRYRARSHGGIHQRWCNHIHANVIRRITSSQRFA